MTGSVDMAAVNRQIIDEFLANNGRVTHPMVPDGVRLTVLTTTGRRSGRPHSCALAYHRHGANSVVVIASAFGAPTDPDWYRNLGATGRATVDLPNGSGELAALDVTARTARGAERDEIVAALRRDTPIMAESVGNEHREVPVVVLEY